MNDEEFQAHCHMAAFHLAAVASEVDRENLEDLGEDNLQSLNIVINMYKEVFDFNFDDDDDGSSFRVDGKIE